MKVCVSGCSGRMGKEVITALVNSHYSQQFELFSGLVSHSSPHLGKDLGAIHNLRDTGIIAGSNIEHALAGAELVIEFSQPENTLAVAKSCSEKGIALVTGTSGFSDIQLKALEAYSKHTRIYQSYNTSYTVNLLNALLKIAAKNLSEEFDVEIIEAHHNKKVDAPSGTAIMLGTSIAHTKGKDLMEIAVFNRHNLNDKRVQGEIGFSSLRAGGIVGDHTVLFASESEVIEFSSRILSRSVFAIGALKAAIWLKQQKPGRLYSSIDMLNI